MIEHHDKIVTRLSRSRLWPLMPHNFPTIFVHLQGACRHIVTVCLMIVQWNLTTYIILEDCLLQFITIADQTVCITVL